MNFETLFLIVVILSIFFYYVMMSDQIKQNKEYTVFDLNINLQGDMPLIKPEDIIRVSTPILNGFDIGTLSTNLSVEEENNINITKVQIKWIKEKHLGIAKKFYKDSLGNTESIYHHVGMRLRN